MYTTYSPLLYERTTRKWKDKLFHETNSDLLSTCMDLPTARYTESEVIEVMNYLLYVFISSSACMHTYLANCTQKSRLYYWTP